MTPVGSQRRASPRTKDVGRAPTGQWDSPADVLREFDSRWRNRTVSLGPGGVYLGICATTDITQPYHSLSYLAGSLNQSAHRALVRDFGIEFWHYVISRPVVNELARSLDDRTRSASPETQKQLSLYRDLLGHSDRFSHAFTALQDPESFYDLGTYIMAVGDLSLLPRLLTILSPTSEYRTFASASPPGYKTEYIDLLEMAEIVKRGIGAPVLDQFYDHHADAIAGVGPLYVGLTVPFLSQLEHSLYLGFKLKQRGVKVVIGGPTIAKFVKYARQIGDLEAFSFAVDYVAPGEGEGLVTKLADALAAGEKTEGIANLISTERPHPLPFVHFENVDALPSPDYSIWDYGLYASPSAGALYSPTRGCYWNKCAFCDYGLAVDGPTSPWRTRTPEKVVSDLRVASKYVRRFFFSVDVLSPSYALKLSSALIDADLDVKWMADFRLESTFDEDKVTVFQKAGCLGAAFGMESADQTTLDAIDKGTNADRLTQIVGAFADAGIPVQLMGFTGFPGETRVQADTTIQKSARLLEKAATVALGKYGLSHGSLVAKDPDAYGIEILSRYPDRPLIPWDIKWRHKTEIEVLPDDDFSGSFRLLRGFPYPFLGATSTLHSLLYFERNPRPPFPIPSWSYELMLPGRFSVIPCFYHLVEDSVSIVMSALTGRILELPETFLRALVDLLPAGRWLRVEGAAAMEGDTRDFLTFLTEHSLALFAPDPETHSGAPYYSSAASSA